MKTTITTILKTNSPASTYGILKRNHTEIFNVIDNIKTTGGFTEKIYMFLRDFTEAPKCKHCLKNYVKFISWKNGFREFCSGSCGKKHSGIIFLLNYNKKHNTSFTNLRQIPKIKEKADNTLLEKYGTTMPMNEHKETIKKKEATSMKKYGVKNAAHAPEIRLKAQTTMKNKSDEDKEKTQLKFKNTLQKKYGVDSPMQDKEIYNKAKETRVERYGVEHCLQNPSVAKEVHKKAKKTMMERYGVTAPINVPGAMEKATKSMLRTKKYIWKTGEISLVQGYEPIVSTELEENGYSFEEIITSPEQMPIIKYYLDGFEHRYYPDIFIPHKNIIIEVKSEWTLNLDLEKNISKFEATKSLGFDFRLEVR